MPTPMLRDESLDVKNIGVQVNCCMENGLDGILIGGNSGEFPSMSLEERKLLFKTAVDAADGRCKIVGCCGGEGFMGVGAAVAPALCRKLYDY